MKTVEKWLESLAYDVTSERDQKDWIRAIQRDARKAPMKKVRLLTRQLKEKESDELEGLEKV
jgi:hypothetical protein